MTKLIAIAALLAATLIAVPPGAVYADPPGAAPIELRTAQMDGVTAGSTEITVVSRAEASGNGATATATARSNTVVTNKTTVAVGTARASATGDTHEADASVSATADGEPLVDKTRVNKIDTATRSIAEAVGAFVSEDP